MPSMIMALADHNFTTFRARCREDHSQSVLSDPIDTPSAIPRADGSTTFSVSNRQKPITIHYGNQLSGWFDLHLDLALAHYRDEVPALTSRLQQDLIDVDSHKPSPPVGYQGGDG